MISPRFSPILSRTFALCALLSPASCAQSEAPQRASSVQKADAPHEIAPRNSDNTTRAADLSADETSSRDNDSAQRDQSSTRDDNTPRADTSSHDENAASQNSDRREYSRDANNANANNANASSDAGAENAARASAGGAAARETNAAMRAARGNLPLQLPGPIPAREYSQAAPRFAIAAQARAFAERAVKERRFAQAADAFRQEAAIYRRKKLFDAAQIQERKAARYETDLRLFIERLPTPKELRTLYSAARLEPQSGAYIGAFIDRDDALSRTFYGVSYQTHRFPRDFENRVGRRHSSYFTYLRYGQPFPRRWAQEIKESGAIPHIAWEPKSLNAVRDDNYLRAFARECAKLKWPIFIRFAGEMNGDWTPYHGNPKLYRQKFRLVHQTLHKAAPLAATIWCVNSVPNENLAAYYPGDDGCDWVGINLYAVAFYDNNPRRPAFEDNPLALIEPIYREYSRRKPIAICEFAASHLAAVDKKPRVQLAIEKTALLYGALPRLYPRIKLIDWFSMNNIKYAKPGRQLNNYSLTAQPLLTATYRRVTEEPFFLQAPRVLASAVAMPLPIALNQVIRGGAALSIWAKTYTPHPKVFLQIGKRIVYASDAPGAHIIPILASDFPEGKQSVTAYIFDNRNRFVARRNTTVIFEDAPPRRPLQ